MYILRQCKFELLTCIKKVTFLHWKETMKLASNALIVKPAFEPSHDRVRPAMRRCVDVTSAQRAGGREAERDAASSSSQAAARACGGRRCPAAARRWPEMQRCRAGWGNRRREASPAQAAARDAARRPAGRLGGTRRVRAQAAAEARGHAHAIEHEQVA